MKVHGDGTIEGLVAGGLPAAVIQQPNMAPNVAGNGPCFSVYLTTEHLISTTVVSKVLIDTKEFDTAAAFDTTNHRFQPTVAGYYFIGGQVTFASAAQSGGVCQVLLYKNGSSYKMGCEWLDTNVTQLAGNVQTLVYLNGSTDYLELYGFQSSGLNQAVAAGMINTYLYGFLARAA